MGLIPHAGRPAGVHRAAQIRPATSSYQPDLLVRQYQSWGNESYIGQNVINSTGASQTKDQSTDFYPCIYQFAVVNNGQSADRFLITGPGSTRSGWRVWYYDSQVQGGSGGNDITSSVIAAGWTTPTLQPGDKYEFRMEAGPSCVAPGGSTYTLNVTAKSVADPTKIDVVRTDTYATPVHNVNIRRRNYDASGLYLIDVQNLGNVADTFKITGPASGAGYTISYFDAYRGGHNITAAVTGAGWTTPALPHAGIQHILAQISTRSTVAPGWITAQSNADSSVSMAAPIDNKPSARPPSFYIVGVFRQPTFLFDTWKSRGINTLFNFEDYGGRDSIDTWTQIAVDKHLYMMREPRSNLSADINQPYLLAWAYADEPDIAVHSGAVTPSQAAQIYAQWKAADPNMPVFMNVDGSDVVQWQHDVSQSDYYNYMQATDWGGNGIYPVTAWNRPDDLNLETRALDRLRSLSDGKPQVALIESSPQLAPWAPKGVPGVTPGQFRAQVWDSVIHGALGIVYFPQAVSPNFSYDNTPASVATEMTKQDALLKQYGSVLINPADPSNVDALSSAPLEIGWRVYRRHTYFFVLNMSAQTLTNQPITFQGLGRVSSLTIAGTTKTLTLDRTATAKDTFAPYDMHVYVI